MTEKYDIIIIGAGIAGCGLAYNLKRFGYEGKVLIIDKKEIGSNAAYGYRNTFKKVIDEYDLPYVKKFSGVNLGNHVGLKVHLEQDFYFIDYKKVCKFLFKKSKYEFRKENAVDVRKNFIKTDKNIYEFDYLIDCSGPSFLLRKLFNLPLPFRYFIGRTNVYRTKKQEVNPDYFFYFGDKSGYVEDFCTLDNKIIQGDWQMTNKVNFDKIQNPSHKFLNGLKNKRDLIKQEYAVEPVSPVLPLVYKNYAFLGDSFGNATPYLGEGIRLTLDTSKILVKSIKENNLKKYERDWKKKYLKDYLRIVAFRTNIKERFKVFALLKNYKTLLVKLLRNEKIKIPTEVIRKYPKKLMIESLFYYFLLRLKFLYFSFKFS